MQPLKRGSIHMKFSDSKRKKWAFNTGGCLIEVTTWAGLTVYHNSHNHYLFELEMYIMKWKKRYPTASTDPKSNRNRCKIENPLGDMVCSIIENWWPQSSLKLLKSDIGGPRPIWPFCLYTCMSFNLDSISQNLSNYLDFQ
jgi:hypothetical protein